MSPEAPRPKRRRRILLGVGLAVVLIAAASVVVALRRQGDISHPDVEFRPEPPPSPAVPPTEKKPRANPFDSFVWPVYGYSADRRRYLPAAHEMRPPFRRRWQVNTGALLEFPPVLGGTSLYVLNDDARLLAIAKKTGRVRWKRRLGVLAAASPAYGNGRVYAVILARGKGQPGRVTALRASDGKVLWSHGLRARAESSPLLSGGRLYFGAEDGTVYALRASDGAELWRYKAHGAVKGGLALSRGKLYFGDYSGHVYALRQDGRQVWQVGTTGKAFGFASGQFYATPAVAFGRVFLGNTDGNVYSFAASSGKLAWRTRTGGYVYSSPAVAELPKAGPMVYSGSYDGTFYALDARSGKVRWSRREGGAISGGATVVGEIVYSANIRTRTTTGYGARTGKVMFRFPDGAYNPVISDGQTLFIDGYKRIYALRPRGGGAR
jgi:outer membrane protein assembly factor BamB